MLKLYYFYIKNMGEIVSFPEKKWLIAQAIEADIASAEVSQNTQEVQLSVFQKLFPQYFMLPGDLIQYLENIRGEQSIEDAHRPLLAQVSEKKQASL